MNRTPGNPAFVNLREGLHAHRALRDKCALAVMIKTPRAGFSKTRLSPAVTPGQAAELSRCFYQDTALCLAEVAGRNPFGQPVAAYAPLGSEEALAEILLPKTILVPQRDGDFGDRLAGVTEDLFAAGARAVAVIDSDSPTVPAAYYGELLEILATARCTAVLGPTDDGGYYALGVPRHAREFFQGIPWSTGGVAAATLRAIRRLGLRPHLLPCWHDVDDAQALGDLQREFAGTWPERAHGFCAPHTRGQVAAWAKAGLLPGAVAPAPAQCS